MKLKTPSCALSIVISGYLLITACKKEHATEVFSSISEESNQSSFIETIYEDAATIADQAHDDGGLSTFRTGVANGSLFNSCVTVTNDTVVNPRMLTVDFGTGQCLCLDGKSRSGKIKVAYTGHYHDSASTHTFTFDRYTVNGNKVGGTKTVRNNGHNAAGNLTWSIAVNGTVEDAGSATFTVVSNLTRELIAGEATTDPAGRLDDVYNITGSGSGISYDKASYSYTITSPLIKSSDCKWIHEGKVEFIPGSRPMRFFDYGNGTCDSLATVTISDTPIVIILF